VFEQKVEVAMTSLGIENDRLHPAVQRLALELVARGRQVSNHPYTTPIPPLYHPYTTPIPPTTVHTLVPIAGVEQLWPAVLPSGRAQGQEGR